MDTVHVFLVDDESERDAYTYLLPLGVNVHYGPIGLHHMRNHIHRYFPVGTHMVCMDDDIEDLVYMQEDHSVCDRKSAKRYPLSSYPPQAVNTWLQTTFAWMEANSIHLFGIYAVKNGYFMKSLPDITTDLRFCVGSFWGCINTHTLCVSIEEKEDVERTLKAYVQDHGVLRFNHIAPVTRYYKTKGGMQARGVDRLHAAQESAQKLVATFSDLCSLCTSKKSGVHEVKLKNRSTASCQIRTTESLLWLHLEGRR